MRESCERIRDWGLGIGDWGLGVKKLMIVKQTSIIKT